MIPLGMMRYVFTGGATQRGLIEKDHAIDQFPLYETDEALCIGAHIGRSRWQLNGPDAGVFEGSGVLGVAVEDEIGLAE